MAELAGERILVTGGAGFIGRAVVAALRERGAQVVVVDRFPANIAGVESVVGDLRDEDVLGRAVRPGLSGIVHLAAVTSVLGSLREPVLVHEVNVDATAHLLELARTHGIPRLLMSSTNAVVGNVGDTVIHEDLPPRPLTPYGATKAAAEMLLSGYAGAYGMSTCSLRLTNVYGPGMAHKDSLVPRLMRAVLADTPIQVYGSGGQRRDFVHVQDVVAGLLLAWRTGHVGSLIIGAGRSPSVLEVIDAVGRVTGTRPRVEHVPAQTGEMPAVVVSIDRARALGYHPAVALSDGLASVWADFQTADLQTADSQTASQAAETVVTAG
jgi:UDP-glucose 4-epimerase